MAVIFEFEAGRNFHFTEAFGQRFNIASKNNRVTLPEAMGDGFIQEVYLDNGISLCMHSYTLKEELKLVRMKSDNPVMLTMKFDCIDDRCEMELGTSNFFSEMTIPPGKSIVFLVAVVSRLTLINLLKLEAGAIYDLLAEIPSFLIHERMTQPIRHTIFQLVNVDSQSSLHLLIYQSKALELIYQLFSKLIKREEVDFKTINKLDADKIFAIRSSILADLTVTPKLPQLAAEAGMSMSKLKALFTQIFGISIYNFYQAEKMERAAQLLQTHSVSETGYMLGYTNLSHFSRLFEKHHHIQPKKFKNDLGAFNK